MLNPLLSRLLSLLVLLAPWSVRAATSPAPYQVGDTVAPFTVQDQHGKRYTYEPGAARRIVVAFAMSPGKAANAFFEQQSREFLDEQRALFISNIHGMGIARTFALPKMRKYPHRILLSDAEGFLARYPEQEDRLTVLDLDDAGKVTAIRHVDPKKDLPGLFAGK